MWTDITRAHMATAQGRLLDPKSFSRSPKASVMRSGDPQSADLSIRFVLPGTGTPPVTPLLVRGLKSDLVSEQGVAELRMHLPQLEVFDVVGAGHMVAGDKNDAFNDGMLAFLRKHMPPV